MTPDIHCANMVIALNAKKHEYAQEILMQLKHIVKNITKLTASNLLSMQSNACSVAKIMVSICFT